MLDLTYDGWRDLESALLDRQMKARDAGHNHLADRLTDIRRQAEEQVYAQKPRW